MGCATSAVARGPVAAGAIMADQYRLLMARYQAGDGAAFEELYARVAPGIPQAVRALDPEARVDETVEEIFLCVHRARGSYDPRRDFDPWLTAIVHHVTEVRRRRRHPRGTIAAHVARRVSTRPSASRSLLGLGP
jgi:DNA-directed RNA polymerase specialized sigma24 family protein